MLAVVTVVVLLALGAGLGIVVGDALGIRTEPATQMEPAAPVVPASTAAVPAPRVHRASTPRRPSRVDVALEELADAAADASETRGRGIPHGRRRSGRRRRRDVPADRHAPTRCASRPRARPARCAASTTSPRRCAPAGRSPSTSARRSPRGCRSAWSTWARSASTPDPAAWAAGDDYSHASKAFADVLLPDAAVHRPGVARRRVRRLRRVHPPLARERLQRRRLSRASSST